MAFFKLFSKKENPIPLSPISPPNEDGATSITGGLYSATSYDTNNDTKSDIELITRYRDMAQQPEMQCAIDDIVNEAISYDDDGKNIAIVLDDVEDISDKVKNAIRSEFDNVLKLLNYKNMASDIFRRFYIDGRLFYNIIIDEKNPNNGIIELRYVDPRKIKKIKEIKKTPDEHSKVEIVSEIIEYYLYNDKQIGAISGPNIPSSSVLGIKIPLDSIIYVNSGLVDGKTNKVLSYLHNAFRPLNQLRMIEDAALINKLVRAPMRRVFTVHTGTAPKVKADQHVQSVMNSFRNKLVYNHVTGEMSSDRAHMSMLDDYFVPKTSDGKTIDIDTLPSTDTFSNMDIITYFEQKLYKALYVPINRLTGDSAFSIGRSNEVTREELKFFKFIERLRLKFTSLFDQALRIQLILKGVCTSEEWDAIKENVSYDFIKDNNFAELKEAELMQQRLGMLSLIDPFRGVYYSRKWIQQNVLHLPDEEIEKLEQEMTAEMADDIQKDGQKMMMQAEIQNEIEYNTGMGQQNNAAQEGKPELDKKNPYNV